MCGHRRQRPGKAEAVGQHDVASATHAKLFTVERLPVKEIAYQRLGRTYIYIIGINGGTSDVPAPIGNTILQFLILGRVILLCPHIFYGPFKIEGKVVVVFIFKTFKRLVKRVLYIIGNGRLHRPVPLRIKVRVGDKEKFFIFYRSACFIGSGNSKKTYRTALFSQTYCD